MDVPAKLAARVRMLSTGHGRKNDDADAVSVGIAALSASGLRPAAVEDAIIALRAFVEHRDDIVHIRTQTVNRLHVLLTELLPVGRLGSSRRHRRRAAEHRAPPRAAGHPARLAAELIGEIRASGPAHRHRRHPHH